MGRTTSRAAVAASLLAATALLAAPVGAGAQAVETVTLEEVLEEVPERHETREITEAEIEESRAMRRQALGALLPQLDATADVTRQSGEEVEIGGEVIRQRYDWSAGATASVTIFDGPAYFEYWEADALVDVTEASARWQRRMLELEATVAFLTLASAQRDVEIAEAAIDWRREYLEEAEAMREAGLAVGVDVSRARSEMLEAEQDLLEAEAARGDAADALASLMGRSPDGGLRADVDPDQLETEPPETRVEVTEQRADFTARRFQIDAAELNRRATWWGYLPRVSLNFNPRWSRPSAFDPDRFNWTLSLTATWSIFQGGARLARADAAQAEVRRQQLELERDLREADVEMAEALREWRSTAARIEVARQQLEVAEQTYDQVLAQYEQGLVSSLEVSDASQQLLDAQQRLNQIRLQARIAEARYRYLAPQRD